MTIVYDNLSETQFEELVIEFCVELLGHGVQGFVTGMDGGRDARFVGKAKLIPSDAAPWDGTIVIQAKHTEMQNKSWSEADFSGENDSSVLAKELPRIKALLERGELDYYMLFSNRRLTGVTDEAIRGRICKDTGLSADKVVNVDVSQLDRYCKRFPQAIACANLTPGLSPPEIDPNDLAEVITKIANFRDELDDLMEGDELPPENRTTPAEKNLANGLREEYFKKTIRPRMVDFPVIRHFLGLPESQPLVRLYEDMAEELAAKLVAWSRPDVPYERLLEQLIAQLLKRDFDLRAHRRLTRTVVFYMYCNCDIGGES
ncbi:ABC-three component system protein [Roseiconus lacunae]|uniref:ABC-three component system protein n=1 Tax=Roseiconus lacunae TaxID=2605694 RepID=UPI001E5CB001|nr:ABC-three component system protein [Roseiconus lacunae]MCD0458619.1 hypothetical protein [Roseiconus lacunae]